MYEIRRWSNVFCLRENDPWLTAIRSYVYDPHVMSCETATGCKRHQKNE